MEAPCEEHTELLSWATSQRSLKRLKTFTKKEGSTLKSETCLLHQVSGNEEFFIPFMEIEAPFRESQLSSTVSAQAHLHDQLEQSVAVISEDGSLGVVETKRLCSWLLLLYSPDGLSHTGLVEPF